MSTRAAGNAATLARITPFLRHLLVPVQAGRAHLPQSRNGEHASRVRMGVGSEFADHRAYQPGDDPRHVNARLWARLGKPMVRQYQQEQARSFLLVVDHSASMAFGVPSKWQQAWPLAAAVLCAAAGNHDAYRVLLANETTSLLPPAAPLVSVGALAATELVGTTKLLATAAAIVTSRFDANTEVIWVSDFLDRDGVEPALDRLRQARCKPLLVCTQGAQEGAATENIGEVLRLRDAETAATATVEITRLRLQHYLAAHAAYYKTLERFCARTGVPFVRVFANFEADAHRVLRAAGLRA